MLAEPGGQWRRKAAIASSAAMLVLAAAAVVVSSTGWDSGRFSLAATVFSSTELHGRSSQTVPSPTMSLVEYMKSTSFDAVPMLSETDVKRAMACPKNRKCSFRGTSEVKSSSEMEHFDPTQKDRHSQTKADSSLEILFDVFETNSVGCLHGHVAYQLNITKVHSSSMRVHETSDDAPGVNKQSNQVDDNAVLEVLRAHPFVFIQDKETGAFIDYVVSLHELPRVATMKRSMAEGLNPIVGVGNQDQVAKMKDGAMLFQLRQAGVNGVRNTAYRLWHDPNEPGSHKIEHVAQLFSPQSNEELRSVDEDAYDDTVGERDQQSDEPKSCPPSTTGKEADMSGRHHGRAEIVEDAVVEASEEADMHLGHDAGKEASPAPNEHAEEDEKQSGEEPVEARVTVMATFNIRRMAETPFQSPCTAHPGAHFSDRQDSIKTFTLEQWKEAVSRPEEEDAARSKAMVRRSFSSPALREDLNEEYTHQNVDEEVRSIVTQASADHILDDPLVTSALRKACDHGAVRRGVFAYLGDDTVAESDKQQVAVHFLGACGSSVDKQGTQGDVVSLAANSEVDIESREQALWALAQIRCPLPSTLDNVHKLSQGEGYIAKASMLIVGALLKNSRGCTSRAKTDRHAKFDAMQSEINAAYHTALKEGRLKDVETALYAMSNSGGAEHIRAIQNSLSTHPTLLQSVSVQAAALHAVSTIALATPHGAEEHEQLLAALSVPHDHVLVPTDENELEGGALTNALSTPANPTTELDVARRAKRGCHIVGYENLICSGRRLPQSGAISSTLNSDLGVGRGKDWRRTCVNYVQTAVRLTAAIEADLGRFHYLNPLAMDILFLKAQMFMDHDKSPVSGYFVVFGFVVTSLSSVNGRSGMFTPPYGRSHPNVDGRGEGHYTPFGVPFGQCGVQSQNFEGLTRRKEQHKDIVHPYCVKKYGHACAIEVGPVELRIDGFLIGSSTNRLGVASHATGDWWAPQQCKKGVYVGHAAADAGLRFEISCSAQIVAVRGELFAMLSIVNMQFHQTGELVPGVYGKSAKLHFNSLSGRLATRLWIWRPHCWWATWYPKCSFGWRLDWDKTLWSWKALISSGNLLCSNSERLGCESWVRDRGSYLPRCLSSTSFVSTRFSDISPTNKLYVVGRAGSDGQALTDTAEDGPTSDMPSCYMEAGAYRGSADVAADGKRCLPWPKGSTSRYRGSGLLKDPEACSELPMGSSCWEECIYGQETNSYCRDPTDSGTPYCRTGGSDDAPTFSDCSQLAKCSEAQLGCTHNQPDGSDYAGDVAFTSSGETCDHWGEHPAWAEQAEAGFWLNRCRNPDSSARPWCLAKGSGLKEFCDVGPRCKAGGEGGSDGPSPSAASAASDGEEEGEHESSAPPPFQH